MYNNRTKCYISQWIVFLFYGNTCYYMYTIFVIELKDIIDIYSNDLVDI